MWRHPKDGPFSQSFKILPENQYWQRILVYVELFVGIILRRDPVKGTVLVYKNSFQTMTF